MQSSKFKITLKGDEADDSLRLGDLIDQLNAVKQTLTQVDQAVSGGKPSLYYRVTKISMNSPATFEFEAVSKVKGNALHGRRVVAKLNRDLQRVIAGKKPRDAGLELMESYGALVQPMQRSHVVGIALKFDNDPVIDLPRNLAMKVDDILGPDQIEQGSVIGSLDVIDVHNQRNVFKIYPVVGPTSIKCQFQGQQFNDALSGINKFVRVSGSLHFKKTEKFPHLIKVVSIDVLDEKSDRPTLTSLRGMATGAYGGLSSTDYVEKVRNGDW